jgi:hypothetical protein
MLEVNCTTYLYVLNPMLSRMRAIESVKWEYHPPWIFTAGFHETFADVEMYHVSSK